MSEKNTKLVYSTEKVISRKEKTIEDNVKPAKDLSQQRVIVRLDRKQRGGKSVTVIEGLQLSIKEMESLLKQLKAGLGTGGTVKDSSLEIQGDHCNAIIKTLSDMVYRPKRSGS